MLMRSPFTPALLTLVLSLGGWTHAAVAPLPHADPDDGAINLPPGFRALVVADNLVLGRKSGNTAERLRGLAIAPNGDIFAKTKFGPILALRDTNGDGRIDEQKEFGPGDGGTHIAFHNGYLYHSSRTAIYRYRYVPGELVPTSPLETIVRDLPAEKDHDAKAFAFDDQGRMVVEIGSPYNVFSEGDRRRGAKGKTEAEITEFLKTYGGFWRFDAAKPNQTQADGTRFATGQRHALALAWHPVSKHFFMVQMGRDNMNVIAPEFYDELDNAERVSEVMHLLREGANFGWPTTYWDPIKRAHMLAPEYGGDNRQRVEPGLFDAPVVAFPGHWAPLQMTHYTGTQFPQKYRGGMFVTFHGSWNRAPRSQAGYKVVFVPFDEQGMPVKGTDKFGKYETFADGFSGLEEFTAPRDARFRPGGVAQGPDGSLYITDTVKGRLWRVIYTGEDTSATRPRQVIATQTPAPIGADTPGGKIYLQVCAACHMPNGSGVPGMQPALIGSSAIAGDPTRLIDILLQGPAAVLPADREKFSNVMPPFAVLNDADLASLMTYLRKNFAPGSAEITAAQVAARRAGR
jgi:glucose/arabinose dehydrogenase/mono/diheme cytochrome c family protein